MIEIYKVIRQIYVNEYSGQSSQRWTQDFQKGYRFCMGLLLSAIERHPAYNVHLVKLDLEKQIEDLLLDKQEVQCQLDQLQLMHEALGQELANEKASNQQLTALLNLNNQNTLKGMVAGLQRKNRELQEELSGLQSVYNPATTYQVANRQLAECQ